MDISIVVPIFNEEENVQRLHREISSVLIPLNKKYEIIYVNDGSRDRTAQKLKEIKDKHTKIIHFRKNFGQTAAMDAGFKQTIGDVIITLDGDLQNDPKDIPRLLEVIEKGYDIVAGWRFKRKDKFSKRFISKGAKFLRKTILNDKLKDSGCTLRAYRKECIKDLNLYGEMHRFIHIILGMKGYRIAQVKVNHRKRIAGKTKYKASRTFKSLLDMVLLQFWMRFSTRPIHLFGGAGVLSGFLGFILLLYLTYIRLFNNVSIANRPMLLLSILLIIVGIQFLIFGLMADILTKIYYKNNENYSIGKLEE